MIRCCDAVMHSTVSPVSVMMWAADLAKAHCSNDASGLRAAVKGLKDALGVDCPHDRRSLLMLRGAVNILECSGASSGERQRAVDRIGAGARDFWQELPCGHGTEHLPHTRDAFYRAWNIIL